MEHLALTALRIAAVSLGSFLAWRALRLAARSPEHRSTYIYLAAGFGLVAAAAVAEGVLFEFAAWTIADAATLEAAMAAGGFAAILVAVRRSGM